MKKKSWARKTANENLIRATTLLLTLTIACALIGLYISWMFGSRDIIFLCSGIFIGAILYSMLWKILQIKFLPRFMKYKNLVQGEIGETSVNDELKKNLGKGNLIIADVVLEENMGNIDHIVIGPYGVFAIETKTHRGRIVCDGDDWFQDRKIGERTDRIMLKQSPSKQAKSNAIRLNSFLRESYPKLPNIWINAYVVFPNKQSEGDRIVIKNNPKDCKIFNSIPDMMEEIKKEKYSFELTLDDLFKLENIFMTRAVDITITN